MGLAQRLLLLWATVVSNDVLFVDMCNGIQLMKRRKNYVDSLGVEFDSNGFEVSQYSDEASAAYYPESQKTLLRSYENNSKCIQNYDDNFMSERKDNVAQFVSERKRQNKNRESRDKVAAHVRRMTEEANELKIQQALADARADRLAADQRLQAELDFGVAELSDQRVYRQKRRNDQLARIKHNARLRRSNSEYVVAKAREEELNRKQAQHEKEMMEQWARAQAAQLRKEEFMKKHKFQVNDFVGIQDCKTDPELNGKVGKVKSLDYNTQKYNLLLKDGTQQSLSEESVKPLNEDSKHKEKREQLLNFSREMQNFLTPGKTYDGYVLQRTCGGEEGVQVTSVKKGQFKFHPDRFSKFLDLQDAGKLAFQCFEAVKASWEHEDRKPAPKPLKFYSREMRDKKSCRDFVKNYPPTSLEFPQFLVAAETETTPETEAVENSETININGMTFKIYDVPSDGNCFYHAFGEAIKGKKGIDLKPDNFRHLILFDGIDVVMGSADDREYNDKGEGLWSKEFIKEVKERVKKGLSENLSEKSLSAKEWGGVDEACVLSRIFKIAVELWEKDDETGKFVNIADSDHSLVAEKVGNDEKKIVRLLRVNGNHWKWLERVEH